MNIWFVVVLFQTICSCVIVRDQEINLSAGQTLFKEHINNIYYLSFTLPITLKINTPTAAIPA
jgi:hypothetical protein